MTLSAWILAAMTSLAPGRDHTALADAIATVAEERPLFRDDTDRIKTASFMVAVAFRESSFKVDAIGDKGRARCAFQLWAAPKAVLTDPLLCTRIASERLEESMRICGPKNPLGIYASGPKGCKSEKARRISNDRVALAKRLVRDVVVDSGDAS